MTNQGLEGNEVITLERDEGHTFLLVDGVRVAKRGHPTTPQAGIWISLEPGWYVTVGPPPDDEIEVTYYGKQIH
jgi:hypothetical protein